MNFLRKFRKNCRCRFFITQVLVKKCYFLTFWSVAMTSLWFLTAIATINFEDAFSSNQNMSPYLKKVLSYSMYKQFTTKIGIFPIMTSRDDVTDIKQNQICNLCVHTFHLRYHSTMSDLRIEKSPFFTPPLWRHNQKFGGQWRHQKFGHILKTLFWEFGENIQSRFCARRKRPHFGHFSPLPPETEIHAHTPNSIISKFNL